MKKTLQNSWLLAALAAFLSVGMALSAQDSTTQTPSTPPSTQAPDSQQPMPNTDAQPPASTETQSGSQAQQPPAQQNSPSGQMPEQRSDAPADATTAGGTQSFTGTIVKSGDKYVFQDAASGNTYDIDHQDEVQKFEGKKVKVHGTLDSSSKTIHLQ